MSLLNLTFLAPMALLGLVALAVPIYLHMRHKPRAEAFKFPAIDFLLKAQKKKKRRFRTEQLWLMLFRIAIICLMAMLFAKPFIDEQFGDMSVGGNKPMILLLDDTPSMLAGPANARFFDEAVARLLELTRKRGAGAPTRLLLASRRSNEARTSGEVRELLTQLKCTTVHYTLDAAYQQALELVTAEGWEGATIQIFTDGSRTAWRDVPSRKPDGVEVIYTSLRGNKPFGNIGITGVNQPPGDSNSVEVTLHNSAADDRALRLQLRGSGMNTVSQDLRIKAREGMAHYFALPDEVPPRLTASIPADDFDLDNEVLFVPRPNRLTELLIVDGDPHPEPLNSESFFLKNALGFEDSEKYGFRYKVVTPVGLTMAAMEAADVIFLLNVDLPAKEVLKQALAADKGVFIGMGEQMDYERWNEFFGEVELEMWEVKSLENPTALQISDFDHPFFQPIDELEWQAYLRGVDVSKFRLMSTGRSNAKIQLSLGDGSPLLLSRELKEGRLMIWTSSMDVDWSNFPLEFGYVPFVRQAATWLAGRDAGSAFANLTTGALQASELVDTLSLKYTSDAFAGLDHAGPKPGIYTRAVGNRTEFVRVGLDPRELDFTGMAPETEGQDGEAALAELGFRSYLRTDLAPGVQWLLFLLLLVETLVAGRITLSWGSR